MRKAAKVGARWSNNKMASGDDNGKLASGGDEQEGTEIDINNNDNKCPIERRARKQLQQQQAITSSAIKQQRQKRFSSGMLEQRRSTHCSSLGANTSELCYDSLNSSGPDCPDCPPAIGVSMSKSETVDSYIMGRLDARERAETSRQRWQHHQQQPQQRALENHQICPESTAGLEATASNNRATTISDEKSLPAKLPERASPKKPWLIELHSRRAPVKKREHWDKNIEFLLAVIGFAVDLGNVWRFPYICYKNGGGAFLVPYTIMFILGGLPIFYLEMSLGQYFSSGCLTVWRRVCPLAKGIGYAMCMLNFFTGLFYNTIISWAVFFFVESFAFELPWTSCNNPWNSPECRTIEQRQSKQLPANIDPQTAAMPIIISQNQTSELRIPSPTKEYFEREVLRLHHSTGINDLGSIRIPLAVYLAIVFLCIYFAIWKGVKSTGKAVWITALLPYFVLLPLLVRGVFLDGSFTGIKYYLYPDWNMIFEIDVWVEAAKQIYFSLGPGFGTLMALSSYNKFHHNCRRDALVAASVNYFASFIAGLVIFAVLGYMATIEKVPIATVATEGPGLVFQVYPEGLATMRHSSLWSVLFFTMVISLGIDSTFGGLESVITGLCDEYPRLLRAHRGIFIGLLIIVIYLCSVPTTTYGGSYVIFLIESYGTSLSLLFIVLAETIVVCWIYGVDRFCSNLQEMYGERPGIYWRICWKYISPTLLLLIFCAACYQEFDKYQFLRLGDYVYPAWAPTLGLLMTSSSVCCVPIYAIYYFRKHTHGSFSERWRMALRPIDDAQENQPNDRADRHNDPMADKIRDQDEEHLDTNI